MNWCVQFSIDVESELARMVMQHFGYAVNNIALSDLLPITFYPVSAPPYTSGGPEDFLYWMINSRSNTLKHQLFLADGPITI